MEQTKQIPYYQRDVETILKNLESSSDGLEKSVAKGRLNQYGPNALVQIKKQSWFIKYLKQFKDFMIILLAVSSMISLYLGDQRTSIVLLALIGFNTIIGFLQEFKAEKIMDALSNLVVPDAKVKRSKQLELIHSNEVVLGDIIYIEEGDSVPADLRIIEESELSTNDFALTGESNPTRKFTHTISTNTTVGMRNNLCFMGTTVATGHAYGVVIATGMNTELGRIANMSQDTSSDVSPLQKEVNHIASRVTQGTVILCSILLPIAIKADLSVKDAFLFAIGIASSIIPQGLPAEINTALAQAANKLAKARALVKTLSAVETLGATNIICTDKTGTLTKNQMTVEKLLIGDKEYSVSGTGYENNGNIIYQSAKLSDQQLAENKLFFVAGVMASNARINPPDEEHKTWYAIGDPTEASLVTLAHKANIDTELLNKDYPEIKEFTFDSGRKRMSSLRKWGENDQLHLFVKGAPESVLEKCQNILINGKIRLMTKQDQERILSSAENLAKDAMRNIAVAYRVMPNKTDVQNLNHEQAEQNLTYVGTASMIDPLRDEVPDAIKATKDAHIAVSIITGDNAITAQSIAMQAGLANSAEQINLVKGEEVKQLSDDAIIKMTSSGSVIFSRVSPEDKLRIVGLIKDSGKIVAVTGDGINDAPALKRADIGVAMGKTGTDVAKQSSDIVLLDDSFHTLVGAVQEGRIVFQNIKKGALSCFTSNYAELIVNLSSLLIASLLGVPLAITVMQILAIDLIAEIFPISALGWDKADRELMQEPPRNPKAHILSRSNIVDLLWCGLLIGGLAFANYLLFYSRNDVNASQVSAGSLIHMKATTMTYLTIVMCQLGNILQRRTQDGLFSFYQFHNPKLWLAICLSLFCVANIIYNPIISTYFNASSIGIIDWAFALTSMTMFLLIRELQLSLKRSKIATAKV